MLCSRPASHPQRITLLLASWCYGNWRGLDGGMAHCSLTLILSSCIRFSPNIYFTWFRQGRNKSGQVGFFPETYIEVGSAANHSPPQITPSNSYTDGHPGGSPVSVASIGQATSAATKYCKFIFFFASLCYSLHAHFLLLSLQAFVFIIFSIILSQVYYTSYCNLLKVQIKF